MKDKDTLDLNALKIFVRITEIGSISGAARDLGIPKSSVSVKLSELEKDLGVQLIKRSSRYLKLTDEGTEFFKSCQEVLEILSKAKASLSVRHKRISGVIKITAPNIAFETDLPGEISKFTDLYPDVSLEYLFSDESFNLEDQSIDFAIRGGTSKPLNGYTCKKMGDAEFIIVGSPGYFKGRTEPTKPKDLLNHVCIRHSFFSNPDWILFKGNKKEKIRVSGKISANSHTALKRFCEEGHGLAVLPARQVMQELSSKTLIHVLPEWKHLAGTINLISPNKKIPKELHRLFEPFLIEAIKKTIC